MRFSALKHDLREEETLINSFRARERDIRYTFLLLIACYISNAKYSTCCFNKKQNPRKKVSVICPDRFCVGTQIYLGYI